jgi:putative transposase
MGLSRSTFYDPPPVAAAPGEFLVRIKAICDEFECYGYRRVDAALRHQGMVVNSKKVRRLMREHDLHPPTAFQRLRRRNLGRLRPNNAAAMSSPPTADTTARSLKT